MAKYVEIQSPGGNKWAYALDECEDYLILDAYLTIKESGRFAQHPGVKNIATNHLEAGLMLMDDVLLAINGILRQLGRGPITFINGHTTAYANLRGHDKVIRREALLEYLAGLDADRRAIIIDQKRAQAAALAERDYDAPALDAGAELLQRHEVERRRTALAQAQQIELGTAQAEKRQPLTLTKMPAAPAVAPEVMEPAELVPGFHHLFSESEPAPEPITTLAPAVKLGPNRVRISLDTLTAMRQRVAAATPKVAPEPDSLNIRQAIAAMYDDLTDARGRGVTWDQLAAELSDLGVKLSAGTLHTYFGDEKRSRGHTRPRKASA